MPDRGQGAAEKGATPDGSCNMAREEVSMDPDFERTRALLERARGGDGGAYQELFERYRGELERRMRGRVPLALRKLVDPLDVVQEAIADAVASFESFEYRGAGSFGRWLRRILENRLAMLSRRYLGRDRRDVRREVPLPASASDDARGALPGSVASPSEQAAGKEWEARVSACLACLPDEYREIIRLVKLEGRSLAAAGSAMGRSENAAKKLLGRALLRLQEELDRGAAGERR
jgi:RNA polymerase sigma-70 factor (subfamily 1)